MEQTDKDGYYRRFATWNLVTNEFDLKANWKDFCETRDQLALKYGSHTGNNKKRF
jgi:hypothetical protein